MKKVKLLKERLESRPCQIGLNGKCCKICLMGPCILCKKDDVGVCGANIDIVTARNILRFVAGGASAHTGHAFHMLNFTNNKYPEDYIKKKSPSYLYQLWNRLGIVPKIHFEHFKDISEALHASTMGVDADYIDLLKLSMKLGIIDGYYGMYLATELEDKEFGKPEIKNGKLNLGVIKKDKINIAVHGHYPAIAEALSSEVKKKENSDINLIGVCCTGASILARHGIPMAANFVLQEEVVSTGAIEAMVLDMQCIMPSLADLCECFHTKLITTNELCRIPNSIYLPAKRENAQEIARKIIKIARENRKKRKSVNLSKEIKEVTVGFSEYNFPFEKIIKKIKNKEIKGVIAVVGCVNPRVNVSQWIESYKKLSKDYIILTTGCIGFEFGKNGLLDGERFFHLGSCVNNARVVEIFKILSKKLKKQITDMPFMMSCPAPITEKAIAIGFFYASIGVDVHFGYPFLLSADTRISHFLQNLLKKDFKSKIFLESKPEKLFKILNTK